MAFSFYMPDIGEGVVEGEIVAWKVKEGDKVKLDQPIVEVMTDKATVELPSPRAGKIVKIHFQDGQICPVGQILVEIEEDSARSATAAAPAPAPARPVDRRGRRRRDPGHRRQRVAPARARDPGDPAARAPARRRDRPRPGDRQARPGHHR